MAYAIITEADSRNKNWLKKSLAFSTLFMQFYSVKINLGMGGEQISVRNQNTSQKCM